MQFAEMTEHILRPDLNRSGTSGMKPGRATRYGLQRGRRRAGGGEHRQRIGLSVERIDLAIALGPMPADAGRFCQRTPQGCGRGGLILGTIATKYLSHFEQGSVGKT